MVLRCLYILELTDVEDGGLEMVDPSWCKYFLISFIKMFKISEQEMEVDAISELDVMMSDVRSEFSEYSTISRSLFGMIHANFLLQKRELKFYIPQSTVTLVASQLHFQYRIQYSQSSKTSLFRSRWRATAKENQITTSHISNGVNNKLVQWW